MNVNAKTPEPAPLLRKSMGALRSTALWRPGILVMLADCDAGNIVTAAQSGAQWGVRLLPLLIALIPLLYMIQELSVRLGIFSAAAVAGSIFLVCLAPDLVALNVAVQVINAVMLPLVVGLLVVLAVVALPRPHRPRGAYVWLVCGCAAIVSIAGLAGAVTGW